MNNTTRKVLDKSFTSLAWSSLVLMGLAICIFLIPIVYNGAGAVFFTATVEHDKFLYENLDYHLTEKMSERIKSTTQARAPLYKLMQEFESPENATEIESKIIAARVEAIKKITQETKNIESALNLDSSLRIAKIREIAQMCWSDYVEVLKGFFKASESDGSSILFTHILKKESDIISDEVKEAITQMKFEKKPSVIKRVSLRRGLCESLLEQMKSDEEALERKNAAYNSFKSGVFELLGPATLEQKEKLQLMRQRYGQPRMNQARDVFAKSVEKITIISSDKDGKEFQSRVQTADYFKGTKVAQMLRYIDKNFDAMLAPHFTAYWGFFFDDPYDSNIFGGIWPMILGTFYLTIGSMVIAAPLGIIAAIYFSEYAKGGKIVSLLRMCVGTLAGVPSIVFGLFGLAFLINTLKVSESKSVLAGSITLALLILPTIIRACEEALKAVPNSYREAALGLGAGKWKAICTVILPAALPAMFTGIIISMGRAAGETAPIIFTAATSTGAALAISDIFTQATPALPWNIYNICSEHEMAERVSHVQYGMVLTLIGIVLTLNFVAIYLRARIQRKMKS